MSQAQPSPEAFTPAAIAHPASRVRGEGRLPYRLAMPLVAGFSLALWGAIWKLGLLATRIALG